MTKTRGTAFLLVGVVILAMAIVAVLLLGPIMGNGFGAAAREATLTASPAPVEITVSATKPVPATVSTATLTTVPSPASSSVPTTFEETFDDNSNNWYTNPTLVDVVGGTYRIVLDCPGSSASATCGNFILMPFSFPTSFHLQIEATITKATEGAGVLVGFEVRRTDEGYYYINYVATKGMYEISRITQTGTLPIVPETQTNFLKPGVGERNLLGIDINGAELTPFVNGSEFAPVRDGHIRTAGDTYLVVLVERGHSAELLLDNLMVERIE